MEVSATALFMSFVILGGVALQWPLGRLSDLFDRRRVIVSAFAGALAASLGIALVGLPGAPLMMLGAAFGGLSWPTHNQSPRSVLI